MKIDLRLETACRRAAVHPSAAAAFAFATIAAMCAPSLAAAAADTPKAGVAGAVVGDVDVAGQPRPEPQPVQSGMDIFMQDRIATAVESRLQVLLLDETVFTVGPKSKVTIDKFVYEPDSGTGELTAEFSKGFMRYVSGKVGEESPENVTVETPASTIGIRGTSLYVSEVPDEPDTYVAGLLGPGPDNTARAKRGGFTMSNAQGTVTVSRAGFGAYVTEGEAPSAPTRLSSELLDRLHTNLRPRQGDRGAPANGTSAEFDGAGAGRTARAGIAQTRANRIADVRRQNTLDEADSAIRDANTSNSGGESVQSRIPNSNTSGDNPGTNPVVPGNGLAAGPAFPPPSVGFEPPGDGEELPSEPDDGSTSPPPNFNPGFDGDGPVPLPEG